MSKNLETIHNPKPDQTRGYPGTQPPRPNVVAPSNPTPPASPKPTPKK